ncbi:hypothetical protein K493DRAFT_375258 [Basidiobolus meristosporus CBS 931.73]|uniref:Uncharacterized protein n=1 Tax=Basidiobolus meristosporus CBS 931.73 TaxID=1314790 RepID=A0A1Y1Y640_9FUNG|nr:hypothetical protein K493DRAFT_375258 [Basidiobolus meristosporus CBS 931.73]|eukprot:ORX93448.1 hypothetical protein K493DRAFT_375258 [Basidiobolus meristosporus CBS 931.73]
MCLLSWFFTSFIRLSFFHFAYIRSTHDSGLAFINPNPARQANITPQSFERISPFPSHPSPPIQPMAILREDFYVIQATQVDKIRGSEIIRTVLVPATFSLLQLHVALQELFGWAETRDSYHSFRHFPYSSGEGVLTTENPDVIYQLVTPEACEGWIKNIAPGLFIEHTHPHEPAPLFSLHNRDQPRELLTMRILRDERVYKLHHVFDKSSMLEYELETGVENRPNRILYLNHIETIVSDGALFKEQGLFPVVLEALSTDKTQSSKAWNVEIWNIQERLNIAHANDLDNARCYLCRRYHGECAGRENLFAADRCSEYCLHHPSQHTEPLEEGLAELAWVQGRDELILERLKFLGQCDTKPCEKWGENEEYCSSWSSLFIAP